MEISRALKISLVIGAALALLPTASALARPKPCQRTVKKSKRVSRTKKKAEQRCDSPRPKRSRRRRDPGGRWFAHSGSAGLGLAPRQRIRTWLEIGAHASEKISLAAATLALSYRFTRNVEAEVNIGAISADGDLFSMDEGEASAQVSSILNTTLGVSSLYETKNTRVRVSLLAALPGLQAKQNQTGERIALAARVALATRGLQDPFAYHPNSWGWTLQSRTEQDFGRYLTASADLGIGSLHRATSGIDAGDFLYVHVAPGAGVRLTTRAVLGLRVPISTMIRTDDRAAALPNLLEGTQLALEPYLAINLKYVLLGLRATLPVHGPVTPFHDADGVWSVVGNFGAHF